MKSHLFAIIIGLFAGLAAIPDSHAQSAETIEEIGVYQRSVGDLVAAYNDVHSQLMELEVMFSEVADGLRSYDSISNDVDSALMVATQQIDSLEQRYRELGPKPRSIPAQFEKAVAESTALLEKLRTAAPDIIQTYRDQASAIKSGDIEAYRALVMDEMNAIVQQLYEENKMLRANQSAQPAISPLKDMYGSMVELNLTIAAFLTAMDEYTEGDINAVESAIKRMERSQKRSADQLGKARNKLPSFRKATKTPKKPEAGKTFADDVARALDTEMAIHALLEDYPGLTKSLRDNGELSSEELARLDTIGVEIQHLVETRQQNFQQIQASGMEVVRVSQ